MDLYEHLMWDGIGGGSGGGADIDHPYALLYDGNMNSTPHSYQGIPVNCDYIEPYLFPPDMDNLPTSVDVRFNGVLFENVPLTIVEAVNLKYYGAPLDLSTFEFDWSVYPFAMTFEASEEVLMVITENTGTYPIKIGTHDYDTCLPSGSSELYTNAVPPATYYMKSKAYFRIMPYT